jgi:hypothetical protein
MLTKTYTPIWSKYRPAILKMMIDAANEPQSYQLSNHEFKALSANKKGGFTFTLQVAEGRAVSGLRDCLVAQDLWEILQLSPKASELISSSKFEFSLDKQFVLHVQKTYQLS